MAYLSKLKLYFFAHKVISGLIILAVLGGGYYVYKKVTSTAGEVRYVLGKVERQTLTASVSGSGQVTDVNQIDIKAKTSGDVVYLGVKNGDKVFAGTLIMQLDAGDAQRAVRDAEASLEGAKIALEKLKIENSNENLNSDLLKAYDDGFNAVTEAFVDLTSITTGLDDILAERNLSDNVIRNNGQRAIDLRSKATDSLYIAKKALEADRIAFATINNNSSRDTIDVVLNKAYDDTKLLSSAVKSTLDLVDFMIHELDDVSGFATSRESLTTYTTTLNGHLTSLLTAKTNIKNEKDAAQNSSLDIQSAQLTVTQKENALLDARDNLADYFIRAPYSGIVANINIKKFESVSAGTAVGAVITKEQIALVSMNEVDVAKINLGQEATLTFDAIPELNMSGTVTEINSVGVIDQGVVTYEVKISLGVEDPRVKPSMSVEAIITTDKKENVLVVPNSAIKSQGNKNYVEVFETPLAEPVSGVVGSVSDVKPKRIPVEIGISNDLKTEIVSGLTEGQEIVVRTISGTATTSATAPSIFGSPSGGSRARAN